MAHGPAIAVAWAMGMSELAMYIHAGCCVVGLLTMIASVIFFRQPSPVKVTEKTNGQGL